jgi:hypothetical protein
MSGGTAAAPPGRVRIKGRKLSVARFFLLSVRVVQCCCCLLFLFEVVRVCVGGWRTMR